MKRSLSPSPNTQHVALALTRDAIVAQVLRRKHSSKHPLFFFSGILGVPIFFFGGGGVGGNGVRPKGYAQ